MASGITVEVPLRELLCGQCSTGLRPVVQSLNTRSERFESHIQLPGEPGKGPITVPLEVSSIRFKQDGPHHMRVAAILDLPCSGCGVPHEVSHQLQAVELFVRNLRKCPQGHPQDIRDLEIDWRDESGAPKVELSGKLYCAVCGQEEVQRGRMAVDGASPAQAKILDVDLAADRVHAFDAP